MHGRIKVKTTAEQQEAKRKEREKKLKIYTAATDRAFSKRKNGEYDEESLKITGEILSVNPDFYSLWNYRKETYLHLKETRNEDEIKHMFGDELMFLESCLRVNPKSYGCWNHRCFVMLTMPEPDWKKELELCNLFLEYDERNFHCWDYRRFVVEQSSVPAADELEYTTNKICNNFSNFSSWHYRSKLLPVIYPDKDSAVGVTDEILNKEFETVQNAFFTDPDDQSAWFYHRWLLGRGKKKQDISCVYVSRDLQRVTITTTQAFKIGTDNSPIRVSVDGKEIEGSWCTHRQLTNVYSSLWIFSPNEALQGEELKVSVTVTDSDWSCTRTCKMSADTGEGWCVSQSEPGTRFSHELSAATSSTLKRELESIQELFELEPENKWVLLTIVSLMKALDPVSYSSQIHSYIDLLQNIDPTRCTYYRDLKSRFLIENYLEWYDFSSRVISLPCQKLTTLYHQEMLVTVVDLDLSDNCLDSVKNFACLQCVKKLTVDNNQIADISDLQHIPNLQELSIRNNLLSTVDCFHVLSGSSQLVVVKIAGNPITENDVQTRITAILPNLQTLDGSPVS